MVVPSLRSDMGTEGRMETLFHVRRQTPEAATPPTSLVSRLKCGLPHLLWMLNNNAAHEYGASRRTLRHRRVRRLRVDFQRFQGRRELFRVELAVLA